MIRKLKMVYFATLLAGLCLTAGCDEEALPNSEVTKRRQEEQRLQDQKERAALVEQMKAAAMAADKKREPIIKLQNQINALDEQITAARSRGKDWTALEKQQEALQAQKRELERQ